MTNTLEPIIQQIRNLSLEQREALFDHLEKIKNQDKDELSSVINIYESYGYTNKCPHCQGRNFNKHGKYKSRQRYKCKICDRTFNEFTGTVWHYIHDHHKFRRYLECLAEQKTLFECTFLLEICMQTAFYWRHKILKAFEKVDMKPLKSKIEADETFVLESCKGNTLQVLKNQRKSRKRGGSATKSGVSKEQLCILVACDEHKNTIFKHVGNGKLTKQMVFNALGKHIRKQRVHKAILVTDRNNAFLKFATEKRLIHQTVISKYKQYVNAQGFHIQTVNAIHSRLKKWLLKFNGVASKYVQNYLNFFRLWDKFTNFKERFIYFFRMSVKDNSAFISCQDLRLL